MSVEELAEVDAARGSRARADYIRDAALAVARGGLVLPPEAAATVLREARRRKIDAATLAALWLEAASMGVRLRAEREG